MSNEKKVNQLKLNYNVPITFVEKSALTNDDFSIAGTAINATTTSNNHKFIEEELELSANSLVGVPLLIDHNNSVEAIKGRVTMANYNKMDKNIGFRARVVDEKMRSMINNGLINSVSVGAIVKDVEETEDGFLIPHGITFKELSLVAVPADENATFNIALKEAYETIKPVEKAEIKEVIEPVEVQVNIQSEKIDSQSLKGGIKMSEEIKPAVEVKEDYSKQISEMANAITKLTEKIAALDAPKEQKAVVKEVIKENSIVEAGKYKFEFGNGSLKGSSFSLVE